MLTHKCPVSCSSLPFCSCSPTGGLCTRSWFQTFVWVFQHWRRGSTRFYYVSIDDHFPKTTRGFFLEPKGRAKHRERKKMQLETILFITFFSLSIILFFNSFLSTFLDWKFSKSLTKTSFSKSGSLTERTGVYPSKYLRIKEKNVVNHKHTFLVPRYISWIHIFNLIHLYTSNQRLDKLELTQRFFHILFSSQW